LEEYITLILKDIIIFPNQELKLEFNNLLSKEIISQSIVKYGKKLLIAIPKGNNGIYDIGVLCTVNKFLILPNGKFRINLRGKKRLHIKSTVTTSGLTISKTYEKKGSKQDIEKEKIYNKKIKSLLKEYVDLSNEKDANILKVVEDLISLNKLTDITATFLDLTYTEKKNLLLEENTFKRANTILLVLDKKINYVNLDKELDEKIKTSFDDDEKKLVIKKKIELLNNEIDEKNESISFDNQILKSSINESVKKELLKESSDLKNISVSSPEYGMIISHLEFVLSLPWDTKSEPVKDIKKAMEKLDNEHYGLDEVKERISDYLYLNALKKHVKSPIMCLVGPPGTGKTSIAKKISEAINTKFIKISVGGLNDSSELVGHRRTYIGARAGKILTGISRCGVKNPVILIDEIDKMVANYISDPKSVLLDLLDINQNNEFVDNYVGLPFDLSECIFILTANDEEKIPYALKDRLDIIKLDSFTIEDKINIANNYILKELSQKYDYNYKKIKFERDAILCLINYYTEEKGVRNLSRLLEKIVKKVLIQNLKSPKTIKEKDLIKYLGPIRYNNYLKEIYTSGEVYIPGANNNKDALINLQCKRLYSNEKLIITGNVGSGIKESINSAISFLKINYKRYKIDHKKLNDTFHFHFSNQTSLKDGPSGGLGILISIASLIINKKVDTYICFTGEINLNGDILKVGSIKQKIINAYNSGIKTIYIPKDNIDTLGLIPDYIKEKLVVKPVSNFTEVYIDLFK